MMTTTCLLCAAAAVAHVARRAECVQRPARCNRLRAAACGGSLDPAVCLSQPICASSPLLCLHEAPRCSFHVGRCSRAPRCLPPHQDEAASQSMFPFPTLPQPASERAGSGRGGGRQSCSERLSRSTRSSVQISVNSARFTLEASSTFHPSKNVLALSHSRHTETFNVQQQTLSVFMQCAESVKQALITDRPLLPSAACKPHIATLLQFVRRSLPPLVNVSPFSLSLRYLGISSALLSPAVHPDRTAPQEKNSCVLASPPGACAEYPTPGARCLTVRAATPHFARRLFTSRC